MSAEDLIDMADNNGTQAPGISTQDILLSLGSGIDEYSTEAGSQDQLDVDNTDFFSKSKLTTAEDAKSGNSMSVGVKSDLEISGSYLSSLESSGIVNNSNVLPMPTSVNTIIDGAAIGVLNQGTSASEVPGNLVIFLGSANSPLGEKVLCTNHHAIKGNGGDNLKAEQKSQPSRISEGDLLVVQSEPEKTKGTDLNLFPGIKETSLQNLDTLDVGGQSLLDGPGLSDTHASPEGSFRLEGPGATEGSVNQALAGSGFPDRESSNASSVSDLSLGTDSASVLSDLNAPQDAEKVLIPFEGSNDSADLSNNQETLGISSTSDKKERRLIVSGTETLHPCAVDKLLTSTDHPTQLRETLWSSEANSTVESLNDLTREQHCQSETVSGVNGIQTTCEYQSISSHGTSKHLTIYSAPPKIAQLSSPIGCKLVDDQVMKMVVSDLLRSVYIAAAKELNVFTEGHGLEIEEVNEDGSVKTMIVIHINEHIARVGAENQPSNLVVEGEKFCEPNKIERLNYLDSKLHGALHNDSWGPNSHGGVKVIAPSLNDPPKCIDPIITPNKAQQSLSGTSSLYDQGFDSMIVDASNQDKHDIGSHHLSHFETELVTECKDPSSVGETAVSECDMTTEELLPDFELVDLPQVSSCLACNELSESGNFLMPEGFCVVQSHQLDLTDNSKENGPEKNASNEHGTEKKDRPACHIQELIFNSQNLGGEDQSWTEIVAESEPDTELFQEKITEEETGMIKESRSDSKEEILEPFSVDPIDSAESPLDLASAETNAGRILKFLEEIQKPNEKPISGRFEDENDSNADNTLLAPLSLGPSTIKREGDTSDVKGSLVISDNILNPEVSHSKSGEGGTFLSLQCDIISGTSANKILSHDKNFEGEGCSETYSVKSLELDVTNLKFMNEGPCFDSAEPQPEAYDSSTSSECSSLEGEYVLDYNALASVKGFTRSDISNSFEHNLNPESKVQVRFEKVLSASGGDSPPENTFEMIDIGGAPRDVPLPSLSHFKDENFSAERKQILPKSSDILESPVSGAAETEENLATVASEESSVSSDAEKPDSSAQPIVPKRKKKNLKKDEKATTQDKSNHEINPISQNVRSEILTVEGETRKSQSNPEPMVSLESFAPKLAVACQISQDSVLAMEMDKDEKRDKLAEWINECGNSSPEVMNDLYQSMHQEDVNAGISTHIQQYGRPPTLQVYGQGEGNGYTNQLSSPVPANKCADESANEGSAVETMLDLGPDLTNPVLQRSPVFDERSVTNINDFGSNVHSKRSPDTVVNNAMGDSLFSLRSDHKPIDAGVERSDFSDAILPSDHNGSLFDNNGDINSDDKSHDEFIIKSVPCGALQSGGSGSFISNGEDEVSMGSSDSGTNYRQVHDQYAAKIGESGVGEEQRAYNVAMDEEKELKVVELKEEGRVESDMELTASQVFIKGKEVGETTVGNHADSSTPHLPSGNNELSSVAGPEAADPPALLLPADCGRLASTGSEVQDAADATLSSTTCQEFCESKRAIAADAVAPYASPEKQQVCNVGDDNDKSAENSDRSSSVTDGIDIKYEISNGNRELSETENMLMNKKKNSLDCEIPVRNEIVSFVQARRDTSVTFECMNLEAFEGLSPPAMEFDEDDFFTTNSNVQEVSIVNGYIKRASSATPAKAYRGTSTSYKSWTSCSSAVPTSVFIDNDIFSDTDSDEGSMQENEAGCSRKDENGLSTEESNLFDGQDTNNSRPKIAPFRMLSADADYFSANTSTLAQSGAGVSSFSYQSYDSGWEELAERRNPYITNLPVIMEESEVSDAESEDLVPVHYEISNHGFEIEMLEAKQKKEEKNDVSKVPNEGNFECNEQGKLNTESAAEKVSPGAEETMIFQNGGSAILVNRSDETEVDSGCLTPNQGGFEHSEHEKLDTNSTAEKSNKRAKEPVGSQTGGGESWGDESDETGVVSHDFTLNQNDIERNEQEKLGTNTSAKERAKPAADPTEYQIRGVTWANRFDEAEVESDSLAPNQGGLEHDEQDIKFAAEGWNQQTQEPAGFQKSESTKLANSSHKKEIDFGNFSQQKTILLLGPTPEETKSPTSTEDANLLPDPPRRNENMMGTSEQVQPEPVEDFGSPPALPIRKQKKRVKTTNETEESPIKVMSQSQVTGRIDDTSMQKSAIEKEIQNAEERTVFPNSEGAISPDRRHETGVDFDSSDWQKASPALDSTPESMKVPILIEENAILDPAPSMHHKSIMDIAEQVEAVPAIAEDFSVPPLRIKNQKSRVQTAKENKLLPAKVTSQPQGTDQNDDRPEKSATEEPIQLAEEPAVFSNSEGVILPNRHHETEVDFDRFDQQKASSPLDSTPVRMNSPILIEENTNLSPLPPMQCKNMMNITELVEPVHAIAEDFSVPPQLPIRRQKKHAKAAKESEKSSTEAVTQLQMTDQSNDHQTLTAQALKDKDVSQPGPSISDCPAACSNARDVSEPDDLSQFYLEENFVTNATDNPAEEISHVDNFAKRPAPHSRASEENCVELYEPKLAAATYKSVLPCSAEEKDFKSKEMLVISGESKNASTAKSLESSSNFSDDTGLGLVGVVETKFCSMENVSSSSGNKENTSGLLEVPYVDKNVKRHKEPPLLPVLLVTSASDIPADAVKQTQTVDFLRASARDQKNYTINLSLQDESENITTSTQALNDNVNILIDGEKEPSVLKHDSCNGNSSTPDVINEKGSSEIVKEAGFNVGNHTSNTTYRELLEASEDEDLYSNVDSDKRDIACEISALIIPNVTDSGSIKSDSGSCVLESYKTTPLSIIDRLPEEAVQVEHQASEDNQAVKNEFLFEKQQPILTESHMNDAAKNAPDAEDDICSQTEDEDAESSSARLPRNGREEAQLTCGGENTDTSRDNKEAPEVIPSYQIPIHDDDCESPMESIPPESKSSGSDDVGSVGGAKNLAHSRKDDETTSEEAPSSQVQNFSPNMADSMVPAANRTDDSSDFKRSKLPELPSLRAKNQSATSEPLIIRTRLHFVSRDDVIPIVPKPELRRFVRWEQVTFKNVEYRIDEALIQPFKKVVAHGGFYGQKSAIIEIFTSFLPSSNTEHYAWVMDNLFLYVLATVELLALEKFSIVMFVGSTPQNQIPANSLMRKWHEHVSYKLKKNVEAFYIVNPTLYFRAMARLFVSRKVMKKMIYVRSLTELKAFIPTDFLFVPPEIAK